MTDAANSASIPPDPSLEGSGALFSDMGHQSVIRLIEANGWEFESTQPVQLLYRPGKYAVVRNSAWGRRQDQRRRFSVTTELRRRLHDGPIVGPSTEHMPVTFLQEGPRRRSWLFPFDPVLSGLGDVLSIEGARRIAEPIFGRPCSVRSNIVRYRPTKRAVVRLEVRSRGRSDGPPMVLFVKILPEAAADKVMWAASALESRGDRFVRPCARPTPEILVYHLQNGHSMRDALTGRVPKPVPPPEEILSILDELAGLSDPGTPGPSSIDGRLERSVTLLEAVLPDRSDSLRRMSADIGTALEHDPVEPTVVHGDFYEGQLLIDDSGGISGVLDIDDVGMGDPLADVANYTAHLIALAESYPDAEPRLDAHRRAVRAAFIDRAGVDHSALAAREAVAALALATGPLRVQSPGWPSRVGKRIDLAARILGAEAGLR